MKLLLRRSAAFTLIELLIVVAIIAILAAIAVPNFLEAQVRSKVSSSKTNMRSLATALESYQVDWNSYPADSVAYNTVLGLEPYKSIPAPWLVLYRITTPVAYMTSIPQDRFENWTGSTDPPNPPKGDARRKQFEYRCAKAYWGVLITTIWPPQPGVASRHKGEMKEWVLKSWGPDNQLNYGEYLLFSPEAVEEVGPEQSQVLGYAVWGCLYDPTNGTISAGDIARSGP